MFFQLKDVDLPDEFEHAIQDAEVSRQYQQRAREIQTKARIEAETTVIQADFTATIALQEASAQANATLQQNFYEIQVRECPFFFLCSSMFLFVVAPFCQSFFFFYSKRWISTNYDAFSCRRSTSRRRIGCSLTKRCSHTFKWTVSS